MPAGIKSSINFLIRECEKLSFADAALHLKKAKLAIIEAENAQRHSQDIVMQTATLTPDNTSKTSPK